MQLPFSYLSFLRVIDATEMSTFDFVPPPPPPAASDTYETVGVRER